MIKICLRLMLSAIMALVCVLSTYGLSESREKTDVTEDFAMFMDSVANSESKV